MKSRPLSSASAGPSSARASARLLARCALGLGVWMLAAGGPRPAHAGESLGGNVPSTSRDATRDPHVAAKTASDLAQLRAELARVNAEVDALKRGNRNVRDEARLRARLADAEALARRLTEAERAAGTATVAPPSDVREVRDFRLESSPQDTPADLDAKADILADRARRVGAAANQLEARLQAFRTRQELKRRAGQLDQDPFAAFEVSKRHVVASGGSALPPSSLSHPGEKGSTTSGGAAQPPPSAGDSTLGPAAPPPGSQGTTTSDPRGTSTSTGTLGATPLPPSSGGIETSATLSLQFRDALDPATLADIRRLESNGSPAGRALAMQRALQALKAQQDALETQARSLRARAQAPLK